MVVVFRSQALLVSEDDEAENRVRRSEKRRKFVERQVPCLLYFKEGAIVAQRERGEKGR